MRTLLILSILLAGTFSFAFNNNSSPAFHKVIAEAGDGAHSLLRRYHLNDYSCSLKKFYDLNSLSKGDHLKRDNEYTIPVYVYKYNGKSIRSTLGIGDWDKAVRIKKYNELLLKEGLRITHYTESNLLWVPFHEIGCDKKEIAIAKSSSEKTSTADKKSSKKTKTSGTFVEPLFGKHEEVAYKDESLKNKVFYLVSGHGGPDPGARCTSCPNTLCEDEYAYDVTLRVARELMSKGAIVHTIIQDENDGIRDEKYLKCDKDETCLELGKIPLDQKKRLQQRVNIINQLYGKYKKRGVKDQVALVIHVDSRSKNKRQDVFFYHYEHSKTSSKIAREIQDTFKSKYEKYQKGRGYEGYVACRNLFMVRNTLPPAVYVELANIKNMKDQKRLLLDSNREALAQWLCEGVINGIQ